ncbi:MAG: hypothetical protein IRZ16_08290 [Myxococcaceae bacterium]|nr:hypothetical protein [Myxococcaceae bacterium]
MRRVGDPDAGAGGDAGAGTDGGGGDGEVACIDGLEGISIAPAGEVVTIGLSPGPIAFSATGTLSEGATEDLTSRLSWSARRADDTEPGTFAAPGSYQPLPGTGGVVTIEATDGCVTGTTQVTLKLEASFQDPGAAVSDRFDGPVVTDDPGKSPTAIYPSDQTRFPRNIYKVLFQWKRAATTGSA